MSLFVTDSKDVFGKYIEEEGTYNVKVLSSSYAKKNSKKNDMATMNYEVIDGQYQGCKVLYDNLSWDPNDVDKSKKIFNTLTAALAVPDGTPIDSVSQLVEASKGKTLNVSLAYEFNDNRNAYYLRVKAHNVLDPEGSKPNGKRRPVAGKQQNLPTGGITTEDTIDITDDDLPF